MVFPGQDAQMNEAGGGVFGFSGLLRLGWIGVAAGCEGSQTPLTGSPVPSSRRAILRSFHSREFQSPQSRWPGQGARAGAAAAMRITGAPGHPLPSPCPPALCASPRPAH